MIPTAEELAEIGHSEANKYSYEGEWGVRKKTRSDKAEMENFIRESIETRYICFARAVRDAVLEGLATEAESYISEDIARWLREQIEGTKGNQ